MVWLLGFVDFEPLQVAVQPFGKVTVQTQKTIKTRLEKQYRANVIVLLVKPLPKEAFYPPRSRYRADKLLDILANDRKFDKIIGIAKVDISTTKPPHKDWGVFGLGQLGGKSCVVSSFRLGKKGQVSPAERLCRVAIHEVGHTLGLDHCPTPKCTMSDAVGALATVDQETGFCNLCRRKSNRIKV